MSWTEGRPGGKSFTDRQKANILRAWGRKCYVCGASGVPLEFDHITPWAEGGADDESNGAPICVPDHRVKSTREKDRARKRLQAKAKRPAERHPSEG